MSKIKLPYPQAKSLKDVCCCGFLWEVRLVFEGASPRFTDIWGACANPNCPEWSGEEIDQFRGLSSISQEDLISGGWVGTEED